MLKLRLSRLLIYVLVIACLMTASGCDEKAIFNQYTGKMPFSEESTISFGQTVQDVERVLKDNFYYDELGRISTKKVGNIESGGTYMETYIFDPNGTLTQIVYDIDLLCDGKNDEELVNTAKRKFEEEYQRIFEIVKKNMSIEFNTQAYNEDTEIFQAMSEYGELTIKYLAFFQSFKYSEPGNFNDETKTGYRLPTGTEEGLSYAKISLIIKSINQTNSQY